MPSNKSMFMFLYSAIFTRRLAHFLEMLDLDLCPPWRQYRARPFWVNFCEWRNDIKVYSEVHWLDREESHVPRRQPMAMIQGRRERVALPDWPFALWIREQVACAVAFSFDSFRLIVLSRDAFSTVSDIFAASLFHKRGLFVTAAHGGPLVWGENGCLYDLGSLESRLPHAELLCQFPQSSFTLFSLQFPAHMLFPFHRQQI